MRRRAFAAALLSCFAAPSVAQDRNAPAAGWYGTAGAGWVVPRDYDGRGAVEELKHDNGYGVFAGGGYGFGNGFRAEMELGYNRFEHDLVRFGSPRATVRTDGSVDQYSLSGAAFYDIGTWYGLTPYGGLGAGLMHTRDDRQAVTSNGTTLAAGDDSTDLTLFGEIGLGYGLTDRLDIVPAYRLQWIDNGGSGLADGTQHVARIGLRYWFN